MRGWMMVGAAAALAFGGASTMASAQVLGGQVGGALGGTVGGLGGAGASVNGAARVDPALPDATRAVDDTARTTARTARDAKAVHVDAGASVRVARGSRCYYDDYYYDPAYRDGYYYCERTGPNAGASVGAGVHP